MYYYFYVLLFYLTILFSDSMLLKLWYLNVVPGISSVPIVVSPHVRPDNPSKVVEKPSEVTEVIVFVADW